MKLNEMRNQKRAPELPFGTHEVVFDKIQYRVDSDGEVNGAFVHINGYRSLFIPIFEKDNFQLDLLTGQLGCDSYNDEEINKCSGTIIKATIYKRDVGTASYRNVSFNTRNSAEDENGDVFA